MTNCLKGILEKCLLFSANANAGLKFLEALGGLSWDTQAPGHLDTWREFGHSGT